MVALIYFLSANYNLGVNLAHSLISFKIPSKVHFLCRLRLRVGFLYRLGFRSRVSSAYFCIFYGLVVRVMVSAAICQMIMSRRSEPINFCTCYIQIADLNLTPCFGICQSQSQTLYPASTLTRSKLQWPANFCSCPRFTSVLSAIIVSPQINGLDSPDFRWSSAYYTVLKQKQNYNCKAY